MYEARLNKERVSRRIDAMKNCRKTVQLIPKHIPLDNAGWITKVEKAVGISKVPILIIDSNRIIDYYNTDIPKRLLVNFISVNRISTFTFTDDIQTQYDGAVYCPKTKAVFLTKDRAFNRYLIHELGHAKQDKIHNANSLTGNTNRSYLEVHNIIMNENKYQYVEPATNTENLYLQVENDYANDPATVNKINMGFGKKSVYYRVFYTFPPDPRNFIQQNLNILDGINITPIFNNDKHHIMYSEMLYIIKMIPSNVEGTFQGVWKNRGKFNVKEALRALMNWGIKQQIDEYSRY